MEEKTTNTNNDLIIGIHSIREALKNLERKEHTLFATEKGLKELRQSWNDFDQIKKRIIVEVLDAHTLQLKAIKSFTENGFKLNKITTQMFLKVSPLPIYDLNFLLNSLKVKNSLKIFCLDHVTDVNNGAAIMRTAAFYGVDFLIINHKGSFGLSPSFFRIASGATEYVKIVKCSGLPRVLTTLKEKGVECIGFSEEGTLESNILAWDLLNPKDSKNENRPEDSRKFRCLVLGSEDLGLSHAVKRVLNSIVCLKNKGPISTLNVSVASGIAMERYF